jgi:hypothetical protein
MFARCDLPELLLQVSATKVNEICFMPNVDAMYQT